jgi:hypothetical protein
MRRQTEFSTAGLFMGYSVELVAIAILLYHIGMMFFDYAGYSRKRNEVASEGVFVQVGWAKSLQYLGVCVAAVVLLNTPVLVPFGPMAAGFLIVAGLSGGVFYFKKIEVRRPVIIGLILGAAYMAWLYWVPIGLAHLCCTGRLYFWSSA